MISYRILISPLIKDKRMAHLELNQPWYVNDTGLGVIFVSKIKDVGLKFAQSFHRYFPYPYNSILFIS